MLAICLTLAVGLQVAAVAATPETLDGVAAYVNDRLITIGDVVAEMALGDGRAQAWGAGEELRSRLQTAWRDALQRAIERELILAEFKRREARVPERAVDEEIEAIISRRYQGNRAAFLDALARERLTLDDFRQRIEESLAVVLLRRQEVNQRVLVGPGDILDFYRAHPERFRVSPESVRLQMIVLPAGETEAARTATRQRAEQIRAEALAGKDFGELARTHSEDTYRERGGDRGFTPLSALRPELADMIGRLRQGEISPVIEAGDHFFLLRVLDRAPEAWRPLEEVREEIERELRKRMEEELHARWIATLRDRHVVRVLQPDLPE